MKAGLTLLLLAGLSSIGVQAQKECVAHTYQQEYISEANIRAVEDFIARSGAESRTATGVIRIPVVIHNLYHYPSEKVTEVQVYRQLEVLNACFRRRNADSVNTPSVFKPFAADVEIEFVLARSDSHRRSTTGIIRKYTPILKWTADDKMKFNSQMGDDAWDSKNYFNIWVCNLDRLAGYASFPGGPAANDGIVLDLDAFGGDGSGYSLGKTAVHETGHWLGLKHLWGDELCGDDLVNDTPKQASYTPGCPKTTRITCGNGPNGDMYMNYMDFTSDACMNLFTLGQKDRMRSLFASGGPRADMLNSTGLNSPLIIESPIEEPDPKWLHPQLFPNPAQNELNLDLAYDIRWVGSTVRITNVMGQPVLTAQINSKMFKMNISSLRPGVYFLTSQKEDGEKMMFRFIKL